MPATKPQAASGSDPVNVDPRHYRIEFENDYVRALRVQYGARERSVMHTHPESIAVTLTDMNCRFTMPDGKIEDHTMKAGTVMPGIAGDHLPENLTDTRFEAIVFELKPARQGGHSTRIKKDPVDVDSRHYRTEFENDRVRVVRARYEAGESSVMHDHPPLMVTFLTDHQAKFTYPDGSSEEIRGEAGQVRWMPAVSHLPENTGAAPMEVVLVEFK